MRKNQDKTGKTMKTKNKVCEEDEYQQFTKLLNEEKEVSQCRIESKGRRIKEESRRFV